VDAGNGAGPVVVRTLTRSAATWCCCIVTDGTFPNHMLDPAENLQDLIAQVKETRRTGVP
jgi:hypothetical protein